MKSCGGCVYFTKCKNDEITGGLCDKKDCRTDTDRGRKCKVFKAPKYDRLKERKINEKEKGSKEKDAPASR